MANPIQSTPNAPGRGPLAALSMATVLASLGTSIANVGLPALAEAFGAPFPRVQWVVIAYLLAVTSLVVSAGRLGDVLGRRRLLAMGVALFTVASVGCGLAPSLRVLILARAVQGAAAAVMMALTLALAGESVPAGRTGAAIGLLGTMSALGTALGPSLGGVLIGLSGWRALFLALVPLGVATVAGVRLLPEDRARGAARRLDAAGTTLLAVTLSAYALAMTLGRGDFGPLSVWLLVGAAAAGAGFLVSQAHAESPLVPLALLRDPAMVSALAGTALVMTVLMATLVVGPFYLSRGLGLGSAMVGMVMSVGPVVTALASAPAGRFVDRLGAGSMIHLGLSGVAAGCAALALLPASLGAAGYAGAIAVITTGYALFQAANTTAVMRAADPAERGVLSGLLGLARNLGLISGASVMGAVFAHLAGSPDVASAAPEQVAAALRGTFLLAALLIGLAAAIAAGSRVMLSPMLSTAGRRRDA